MKFNTLIVILLIVIILAACMGNHPRLNASTCEEPGTIGSEHVPNPTQGFDISFQYYLPPCYEKQINARFPVIYLIAVPDEQRLDEEANTPMSLADRLIRDRRMAPVILIVPKPTVAYGYHAALGMDLIPYVDHKFNTIEDRRDRGVGGISHGAAIAARMAFQFPEMFGSLGVFSGGIDESEKPTFDTWIASTSPEARPRVLISVGDQDGIISLTQNLLDRLESQNVPYEINIETGGHNWAFWSAHMESYLLWFAEAWD
jgi:enterochelin esterase family protein